MTLAVCIRCGAMKSGAWLRCPECGFVPEGRVDRIQSILVSDEYKHEDDLAAIGRDIRAGREIEYDPALVKEWMRVPADKIVYAGRPSTWQRVVTGAVILAILAVPAFITTYGGRLLQFLLHPAH